MERGGNSKTGISDAGGRKRERSGRWARWRCRRVLRWGLGVVLALLVLYVIWFAAASAMLNRAKARVEHMGDSLYPGHYISPQPLLDQNATPFLEAGHEITWGSGNDTWTFMQRVGSILGSGEKASAEDIEYLRGQLEEFELVLRITDEAMPRTKAWFDMEYGIRTAAAARNPEYLYRRFLATLLQARALVAADEGRFDEAYGSAAEVFRLANWVYQETPHLVTALFGGAIGEMGCRTVEYLMNLSPPPEEARRRILGEAGEQSIRERLLTALKLDRASHYELLIEGPLMDAAGAAELPPWMGVVLDYPLRPYVFMDTAILLNGMTKWMEETEPPVYQQPANFHFPESGFPRWAFFANRVIPDLTAVSFRRDLDLARIDLMKIAFELEEYREEEGGYPESLDTLGGEQLIDPFSGEGYRYRNESDGYVLWSLSANREDDGGVGPEDSGSWKPEGDLVWRVER